MLPEQMLFIPRLPGHLARTPCYNALISTTAVNIILDSFISALKLFT